jgi:hypothetical protein
MATYDQQMRQIERRRKLAQALMQQGAQAGQAASAGRFLVGPSAFSSVAGLASALGGAALENRANKDQDAAEDSERKRAAEALERLMGRGGQPPGMIDESGATGAPPMQLPGRGTDPRHAAALEYVHGLPIDQQRQVVGGQALKTLFPPTPKLERVDLGDRWGILDESGSVVRTLPKGVSPDTRLREDGATERHNTASGSAKLGAETTRRGQDLSAEVQLRGQDVTMRGQDLGAQVSREKLGVKQAEAAETQRRQAQSSVSAIDRTLGAVNDALGLTSWRTAGVAGALMRGLPGGGAGTDALSLARTVDTVKANLSFQELSRMRAESKTGGALGNITERELELLGATVANLDPNQDSDQLRAQLQKVAGHLNNLKELQQMAAGMPGQVPLDDGGEVDGLMQRYLQGAQ